MPIAFPQGIGVYPDQLSDPEAVQAQVSQMAGRQVGAPIPNNAAVLAEELTREAPPAQEYTPQRLPGVDNSEGASDQVESGVTDAGNRAFLFQGLYGAGGPGGAVMPEGVNHLSAGGSFGRENVEETFFRAPRRAEQAVLAGGEAQAQEAEQKQQAYAQERDRTRTYEAQLREQYELRAQEMQRRAQEVEQYTQKYTNDLADRGAFWHNPQNVIAAFGLALMHLGTDNHEVPYKMLNQAIQGDLSNRRKLAEGHLGQLKSNMAEYDRIAGDKIAGMVLAEAEAKRVAAVEIERIAAQLQGPKAKANAAFIANKLRQETMQLYMNFYKMNLYNKPQVIDPRIKREYEKSGASYPGVGWYGFAETNPANQPIMPGSGKLPGQSPPGMPSAGAGSSSGASFGPQATRVPYKGQDLSAAQQKAIESRFPGGTQLAQAARQETVRRAYLEAGVPPGTPPQAMTRGQISAYNKSMGDQEKEANEQLKNVSAKLSESSANRAGLQRVQTDMSVLEAASGKYGLDMDDLLSTKSRATLGGPTWSKLMNTYDALIASDPKNRSKHEQAKSQVEQSAMRLNQLFAGQVNSYYKEHAGSAVTALEEPRLQMYIGPGATYSRMKNFVDIESRKANTTMREVTSQLSPAAQALYLTKVGTKQSTLNSEGLPEYKEKPAREQEKTRGR